MIGALTNHVWQSTVFALVVGLLTVAFRQNRAPVRYWLWLSASLKFFIPFAWLIGVGSRLAVIPAAQQMATSSVSSTIVQISLPFTDAPSVVRTLPTAYTRDWPGAALFGLWLCGLIAIVVLRWRGWQRIRAAVRASSALTIPGVAIPANVRLRSTPGLVEPGVVGWRHPILLVPQDIADHLTPTQLEPVLAHELCHVRRRDNLAAAIHMVAEALFWFHPLVWWIGARLVDERERACDEDVLRIFGTPQAYAEGILGVCKCYVEMPLACVSGVGGSNLRKRIEAIMANRVGIRLNIPRRLLLAGAALTTVTLPLAVGAMPLRQTSTQTAVGSAPAVPANPLSSAVASARIEPPGTTATRPLAAGAMQLPHTSTQTVLGSASAAPAPEDPRFEVASVKLATPAIAYLPQYGRNTWTAANMPLGLLLSTAFDVSAPIVGLPDWVRSEAYTIDAKAEDGVVLTRETVRPLLRQLLAERFKLAAHIETTYASGYGLVVAKGGPKLKETPNLTAMASVGSGRMRAPSITMDIFARGLGMFVQDPVANETGLSGNYDLTLTFAPEGATDSALPSIFTALEEQLGLKLEGGRKVPVNTLVIDHVEHPTED